MIVPSTVFVELTEKCNYQCIHCYNPFRTVAKHPDFDQTLEVINRTIKSGVFEIIFTGGEPFLRRDVLFEGIALCEKNNVKATIHSNISLINAEDIKKLSGFKGTSIYFNFCSSDPKTFRKISNFPQENAVRSIKRLLAAGINISTNVVLQKQNKNDLSDTAKFLFNLGVKRVNFSFVSANCVDQRTKDCVLSRNDILKIYDDAIIHKKKYNNALTSGQSIPLCFFSELDKYKEFIKFNRCGYGAGTIKISQNGTANPCPKAENVLGNILDEPLKDIIKRTYKKIPIPMKCKKCGSRHVCSMGCPEATKAMGKKYSFSPLYAREPLDFAISPRKKKKKIDFSKEQKFLVNKNLKVRKEDDGGLTLYDGRTQKVSILSPNENALFVRVHKHLDDMTGLFSSLDENASDNLNLFLNRLHNENIVLVTSDNS
ncbi:MAG: radical SAM protein [Nanoarchaeota archaeon]|nr:radical SAM protein [Nanoarchaeota archaeon]